MRKMKDSGLEWIGEIPEDWKIVPLSKLSKRMNNGYVGPTRGLFVDDGVRYLQSLHIKNGEIIFDKSPYYVTEDWAKEHPTGTVHTNDVLIVQTGDIGQIAYVSNEFDSCNCHALIIVTPQDQICQGEYLSFLLQGHYANHQLQARKTGALHPHLNCGDIKDIKLPIPPLEIQTKLVSYMKDKTREIDSIIAAKEKTNELLKERRQSIIYEAVTKGLDPTAPMKDSGIEWIGEIPESWDTCKLKYAVECRTEKTADKGASVAYIGLEHVKSDFGVLVDEYEHIWDFEGDTIDFKKGDVLFGKLRPYLAKAWVANFNGKCSSEFWVMSPIKLTSKFLLYTVLSNHFIANIDHSTFGVKMPRAEWEYAGNQLICCPSIAEQENITEYLDLKCSEIDSLISENTESIEMLKEYRQSVIYESVTGKIEI